MDKLNKMLWYGLFIGIVLTATPFVSAAVLQINASDAYNGTRLTTFNATLQGNLESYALSDKSGNGNNLSSGTGASSNYPESTYTFNPNSGTILSYSTPTIFDIETSSFSVWAYFNASQGSTGYVFEYGNRTQNLFMRARVNANLGTMRYEIEDASGAFSCRSLSTAISTGWHHLAGTRTTNTGYWYLDGVNFGNDTTCGSEPTPTSPNLFVGGGTISGEKFNGTIANLTIYSRNLSQSDVLALYNNNTPDTTSLVAWYDFQSYGSYDYATTTSQINVTTFTATTNITVSANKYFNNATTNYATTSYNSTLVPWTIIRAVPIAAAGSVTTFTLNYTNNANSSESGITTTTNGVAWIPLYNATYTISIYDASNSSTSFASNSVNLTANPYNQSYNFSLYLTNSFLVRFVNEETGALITGVNITAYFTGNITSYNYTTSTGYLNATLLNPQNYSITYGGDNYVDRIYVVELTNQTYQQLTLYLLLNSTGTYIRFTVLDQTYQPLNGAVVNAQKKNLSGINYYGVADCTTDNNGECLLFLETLTSTYRFLTQYGGVSRYSSDTILSRDTYTIVLNTGSSTLQDVLDRSGIVAGINYTPVGSFYYTVDDPSNNVQNGILVVERRYGGRWTELARGTGSGSSFTISLSGINVTLGDEVRASGYIVANGENVLTHQISVIDSEAGNALGGGLAFLFLGMSFTIIFIFTWNPIAPLMAFGAFLVLMSWVGIIAMGTPAVVACIVVIGIAIYRMRSV